MASATVPPWRATDDGVMLCVRLTPKSSRDGIEGCERYGGRSVLKVRVRAAPYRGGANAALEKLIAKWLGVPGSCVSLAGGGKSRLKSIAVRGDPGDLAGALEARLAGMV